MDAGPELDAEVARRVFGRDTESWHQTSTRYTGPLPPYSSDIAAAWRIAERFTGCALERIDGFWYCWLGDDDDPQRESGDPQATAPLALCHAALAALADHPPSASR